MLNRTLRCLAALGATSLMGGLVGCGSPATGNATPTTNATVSIDLYDGNGLKVGNCAGTLIAADTVLTAGHCVVGKYWWQVTSPSTGQTQHSSIAYTFDWQNFNSDLSHPLHHDVAIVKLDGAMNIAAYPTLATSGLADGAAAMRIRPTATAFEAIGVRAFDGAAKGFPNYYYTTIDATETLDTGSALIDPTTNTIYGVVSAVGNATGLLYSSRVEMVAQWLGGLEDCSAGATIASFSVSAGLSADCHDQGPPPPPPPPCDGGESSGDDDGGTTGSSSGASGSGSSSGGSGSGSSSGASGSGSSSGGSSGSGSGGTTGGGAVGGSSGASGSGSSGASSGSNGTAGGDGGTCGNGGGYCQGSGCGNGSGGGSGSGGSGSGSSSGGTSSGSNGTVGSSGGSGSGGASSGASGSGSSGASSGSNGTTSSGSGSGSSSGSNGYNGGSSSGAAGGSNGTTGDDDGSGDNGGDNPGCNDSSCGGCPTGDSSCTDNVVDYGGSATTSSGTTPYRPY